MRCYRETRSVTEFLVSCSICLLVDGLLMMETNIVHLASFGELIFSLGHTVFSRARSQPRDQPHSLTYFDVRVKGKTPLESNFFSL